MPTQREKIDALSGVSVTEVFPHPILGELNLRSLSDADWQTGVILWFVDASWNRIPERKKYEQVKLVQMVLVEADGNLSYSDSIEDLDKLAALREEIIMPIHDKAMAMNRPTKPKN